MTFLIVIRNIETNEKRTFEVGIDPNRVNLSQESDAVFAIRSQYGFWDRQKYRLHSLRVIPNGIMEHDKVEELKTYGGI
jgi:hypothetical protein